MTVSAVYRDDVEVPAAKGGENLRLRLTGIDEEDLAAGFVVCSRNAVVPAVTYFNAQLQVQDHSHANASMPNHNPVFPSTWTDSAPGQGTVLF